MRILDRVVLRRLNVLLEKEPREETKRQLAMTCRVVVDVDCVNDLIRWNEDVYAAWGSVPVAPGEGDATPPLTDRSEIL